MSRQPDVPEVGAAVPTIAFIGRSTGVGGSERYLSLVATAVDPRRYRRLVVLPGPDTDDSRRTRLYEGCDTEVLGLNHRFGHDFALALPFFRRTRCEVVLFNRTGEGDFNGAILAARLTGCRRVLVTEHWEPTPIPRRPRLPRRAYAFGLIRGVGLWRLRPLAERLPTALSARLAHAVITVSRSYRDGFVAHYRYPARSTMPIHNGVDPGPPGSREQARARLLPQMGASADDILIGAVARLAPEKGLDLLVRAAALLRRTRPRLQVVLIGEGPARASLESLIRQCGIEERVTLLGFRDDVRELLPALDVVVAPSRREGCSYAILEAMADGRPIVATAVGGTPELIEHGVSGLLVPPEDPPALAAAIASLLDAPALSAGLGARAREAAATTFSLHRMLGRTLAILFGEETEPGGALAPADARPGRSD